MKSILGIGNALVDVMTMLEGDQALHDLGLPKGSMQLVDKSMSRRVLEYTGKYERKLASGGSAANTIHGLAGLLLPTAFIGKVGRDDLGDFFRKDLKDSNIHPILLESETESGCAVALVTPDTERTFATFLGAAIELKAGDLDDAFFWDHHVLHLEGYLVQNRDLVRVSLQKAKKHGLMVSLDMASYNVVEANRDFLREMVLEYVDILFANELEARAFTGKAPMEALDEMASMCHIAVVKLGADGSLIRQGEHLVTVEAEPAEVIDTTGAGDLYAAGFLYGLMKAYPLEICGKLGSLMSAKVIEVVGAKIHPEGWDEIHEAIAAI